MKGWNVVFPLALNRQDIHSYMLRILKKLILFCCILAFILTAGAGAGLYWLVAINPGPEMQLDYIEGILGRESPVFYNDASSKIGVLFQDAHRQYLPYHLIPKQFVNAIVAAEDDKFFQHHGIDVFGITRAMIANIKAGRIIQGGSTITQQTAKNLFKRESRTYKAKLKELLYALQLEYHYSKEKILEFYVNQFFVSGNGHGLGVAARYYFDKDVKELTLLENAFIAGSVKRPNYYNSFTKTSEEAAEKALKRAEQRAAYVLGKMRRLGYINDSDYSQAVSRSIVFRRGRMSFALNTIMDLVRDGLASPEVTQMLEENGISNVSTSGIRIITTIHKRLQEGVLFDLRRELSRLDVRLRGYDRREVQVEYNRLDYPGDTVVEPGAFVFGRIEKIDMDQKNNPLITVSLGKNKNDGIIDRKGLTRIIDAYVRFNKQRWSTADENDLQDLLEQLREGDRVYVSVQEMTLSGSPLLNLERFPEFQGAALVMQEGVIRAMAGGMENRYFNRAIDARRLMGSTFKPYLFAAALQLGWNAVDLLDNRRNIFVFQDRPYFPRPDHISPHDAVSISWTGVNSENLAAIWLLYHLTDQLTPPRLREIASHLGLTPRGGNGNTESYEHFKQRIRDEYGIVVNREILQQSAFDRAVKNLEADFLFDDRIDEYHQLQQLPYGLHFDRYAEEITLLLDEEEDGAVSEGELPASESPSGELSEKERKELELRLDILGRSYLGLQNTLELLHQYQVYLTQEKSIAELFSALAFLDKESGVLQPEGQFYLDNNGSIIFSLHDPRESWLALTEDDMKTRISGLEDQELKHFWEQILLEGHVTVLAHQQVSAQLEEEKGELFSAKPYSMEVLTAVRDYRILVGLQYLIDLGHEMGIAAELEPVLSFPLGSNVISLLDAVRLYESLVTGRSYFIERVNGEDENESSTHGLAVIDRIETVDGETVYARQTKSRNVLEPEVSATISNILQNTVRYGTGKYAHNTVRLTSTDPQIQKKIKKLNQPIPLLGKTGTANQFRNAAFLGYTPVVVESETVAGFPEGYTLGVYVGFDDNRQMARTSTHITGASGALPAWAAIAQRTVNLNNPGNRIDLADLSFNGLPLSYPDTGHVFVPVDPKQGGHIISERDARKTLLAPDVPSILTYGNTGEGGHFEPARFFQPYWKTVQ